MENAADFFKNKRSWSNYKDLILKYYLEPYLSKVATLQKPIVVVDCFAGPGLFDDGGVGSPLIILNRLAPLHARGNEVSAVFIEEDPDLYQRLVTNTRNFSIPCTLHKGPFYKFIDELAALSKHCTMFLYLDPFKPEDLRFTDFESVYKNIKTGQSIETLINFMSTSFLRGVSSFKERLTHSLEVQKNNISKWNGIAGGDYWQKIVLDDSISNSEKVDRIAAGYNSQLNNLFNYVLSYPIRERYRNKFPKYHLVFGTRHTDAVELMNNAMVKARREFVGAQFVSGMLFDNQPAKEVVDENEISKVILTVLHEISKSYWKCLRVSVILKFPCKYTDSEINRGIKQLIKQQKIVSDCDGSKIQDDALLWLP